VAQVVKTTQRLDASGCLSIANVIFDASGVRMRNLPFTPKNVLAELKAAGR
jgi:hypothetical protein